MIVNVVVKQVQHVENLSISIDLSKNQLIGVVGRNGIGKTTMIKALMNLHSADTFKKTSSDAIFRPDSNIEYNIDGQRFTFSYDRGISSLNSKQVVPETVRALIDVELPLPFGQRFNFYQSISSADDDIRQAIVLEDYERPEELILFLNEIYSGDKFNNLVEIKIKGVPHYCIALEESRYIREDYLSSGEYFIINLYRKIQSRCKLIVIDEIDLSLDAAAQVNLIEKLRDFCKKYQVNILFTTHSLAMMQTLLDGELYQMRDGDSGIEVLPESYAFIKSTLFGFKGWDRYILTEDIVLSRFLSFIIKKYCGDIFYEYKIIHVGAATSVVDLMLRNAKEGYLSSAENVMTVLDGDQRNEKYAQRDKVIFIPIESVEKELAVHYRSGNIPSLGPNSPADPKKIYEKLKKRKLMTDTKIFEYLCSANEPKIIELAKLLEAFLSPAM